MRAYGVKIINFRQSHTNLNYLHAAVMDRFNGVAGGHEIESEARVWKNGDSGCKAASLNQASFSVLVTLVLVTLVLVTLVTSPYGYSFGMVHVCDLTV